jgi:hypothetical protein
MNLIIRIASTLCIITSLLLFALPVSAATSTFGLDGGNYSYPEVANHLQAQRFQNTAGTGTLNKLELEFNQAGGIGNVRLGVYADNNGVPGNLLLDAGQIATGSGWVSLSGLNLSVTTNTYYWLAFNLQNGNTVEYQDGQIANTHVWGNVAYDAMPSTFPTISYSGPNWYVMRATVSSSGSTPVPARQWDKTFGGAGNDSGNSIILANDGGYVIAGSTTSFGSGGEDAWLIKTDRSGNKVWDKTFGGTGNDVARSVARTVDGGYILTGYTNSSGAGNRDVWLIKTDGSGNKTWDRTFGGAGDDEGWSAIQANDGGYLIAGHSYSYGRGGYCATWLIKTDSSGNKFWDKTFNGIWDTKGISVIQSTDGGYVFAQWDNSTLEGLTKITKTDSNGNILWTRNACNLTSSISIIQATDGSYIIPGRVFSIYGYQFYLVKISGSGSIVWTSEPFLSIYTAPQYNSISSVIQDNDGGFIISGSVSKLGAGGEDYWLIKTDSQGNLLWDETFGGSQDDVSNSIIRASDGSYILAGSTFSYGSGGSDVWLIKVAQNSGPPPAPTLFSPADGATVSSTSVTFQWSSSSGATNYWLAVIRASDNSVIINKAVGNVTTDTETGFPNDATAYKWVVAAGNSAGWGEASTVRRFTNGSAISNPAAPSLISPVDLANISSPSVTFQWSASSGATNYWLAVVKASDNSVIINKAVGNVTTDTETAFPNDGSLYQWVIAAGNSAGWSGPSTVRRFFNGMLNTPPQPPNLISPVNGASISGASVTFQWSASSGATNYWLAVVKASDGSVIVNKAVGNVTSVVETGFPNNGTQYKWVVAAGNGAGWSTASIIRTFTNGTAVTIPPVPGLISPADGTTVSNTSVTFQWSACAGATNYWLAVVKASDGSVIINKALGNVTSDTETGFPNNGTRYIWTVAAGNIAGWNLGATWKDFINGH